MFKAVKTLRFLLFMPLFCLCLVSCATTGQRTIGLQAALRAQETITLPIHIQSTGLILVEGMGIEDQSLTFLLDTGATRSSIFESTSKALLSKQNYGEAVPIYGISEVGLSQRIIVPEFRLGTAKYLSHVLVVLDDHKPETTAHPSDREFHGLIGMDLLIHYKIYISKSEKKISFIPHNFNVSVPSNWAKTTLYPNPYQDDGRNLKFIALSFLNQTIPALFDTGTELNLMNWSEERYPALTKLRRKLRSDWEYQGAVGSFKPQVKIGVKHLASESLSWQNKDFIVMRLSSLEVLGVGENALSVIGMNFWDQDEILIDFHNEFLSAPSGAAQRLGGSIVDGHDPFAIIQ